MSTCGHDAAGFSIAVIRNQKGIHSFETIKTTRPASCGMFINEFPIEFFVSAVPERSVLVVVLPAQPDPPAVVGGNIDKTAVEKHLSPHSADLSAKTAFYEVSEYESADRYVGKPLFADAHPFGTEVLPLPAAFHERGHTLGMPPARAPRWPAKASSAKCHVTWESLY